MPKIGRPTIDEAKRKQVVTTLRLDKAERDELEAAAKRAGAKFSAWARQALLEAARRP